MFVRIVWRMIKMDGRIKAGIRESTWKFGGAWGSYGNAYVEMMMGSDGVGYVVINC